MMGPLRGSTSPEWLVQGTVRKLKGEGKAGTQGLSHWEQMLESQAVIVTATQRDFTKSLGQPKEVNPSCR